MSGVQSRPDIVRAIRRSRAARAAMRSRRWRATAFIAGLAMVLAGAGTFTLAGLNGSNVVQAAVNQAKSLADLLDQRSPGARTKAELTKTKHARALARRMAAAPKVRQPPAAPPKVAMPDLAQLLESPPPLAPVSLEQPLPLTAISSPPPLAAIIAPPPGGGGVVIPPGGGGGGPVTSPTELPKEPVISPSAVPEPSTWATMLFGFGLIGWRIRASRRRLSASQRARAS
jgi:hypothetical protein